MAMKSRHIRPTVERYDDGSAPSHFGLQCRVNELRYDFQRRAGRLLLPQGSCTDMRGAIDIFRQIDPGVQAVFTYEDGRLDTVYALAGGEWQALTAAPAEAHVPALEGARP